MNIPTNNYIEPTIREYVVETLAKAFISGASYTCKTCNGDDQYVVFSAYYNRWYFQRKQEENTIEFTKKELKAAIRELSEHGWFVFRHPCRCAYGYYYQYSVGKNPDMYSKMPNPSSYRVVSDFVD